MLQSLPELAGLFGASFAAATLVPMPSEAALYAFLRLHPEQMTLGLAVATVGNTAGGMTTYLLGRWLPQPSPAHEKAFAILRRFGSPAAFFAWLPLVGDALCGAAGWLRMRWWPVLAFMAAGRLARYVAVAFFAL